MNFYNLFSCELQVETKSYILGKKFHYVTFTCSHIIKVIGSARDSISIIKNAFQQVKHKSYKSAPKKDTFLVEQKGNFK
jgi:hypothetical protein